MTIEILRPVGNGDLQEFTTKFPNTGEEAWEDIDEVSPDGDSSYIETGDVHAEVQASLFTIGASSIPPTATISSVQVHNYVRRTGGWIINYFHHLIKINGTVYDSANLPCFQSITYETYRDLSSNWYAPACGWSGKWSINPDTSVAWVVADLTGLQIGVRSYTRHPAGSPSRARVSQVYLVINYTLAPAGFSQAQIIS